MQLNPAQMEAVNYTRGPCLVLAGAGSGKTRVIINKIVHLLRTKQVKPNEVLAVTFTNKAAAEMRERVSQELTSEIASDLTISTFHSLGRIILKEQASLFKMRSNFSIFDEVDCFKIVKQIIVNEYPNLKDSANQEYIESVCSQISRWKGELKIAKALIGEAHVDPTMQEIYQKYTDYLRACNAVDFDDLIFIPTRLMLLNEQVRKLYQDRYRYVLVDEYQDTNSTQYYLLMCLVSGNQNFTVVGDDDQSIYSWRGARPENIKQLAHDFPNLKVIKLEQNYRSTARILRAANAIIANNPHVFEKTLFSGLEEGEKIRVIYCNDNEQACDQIASEIMAHRFDHNGQWSDYAVLYRSNSQSRDMEKALMSANIPSKITGDTSFFSRMEVKDLLAWCRVLANHRDDAALLRIINIPQRGIGAQTIKVLTEASHKFKRCLFDCACSKEVSSHLGANQVDALCGFLGLVIKLQKQLRAGQDLQLSESLISEIGYDEYLKIDSSKAAYEWKLKNAQTLMRWIGEFIRGEKTDGIKLSFADSVERLGLREMMDKRNDEDATESNAVHMMTLHAAKGLEFKYVYLIGMEEGILPHRTSIEENNIEEERRLAYVGVTRACKELNLVVCKIRKSGGGVTVSEPSRFIAEMPEEDLIIEQNDVQNEQSKENQQKNITRALNMLAASGLTGLER